MVQAVISIGSNVEREASICAALDSLQQLGELQISSVYESEPYNKSVSERAVQESAGDLPISVPRYYNLVVSFQTALNLFELKASLRNIESQQLRQRRSSIVSIDLDILFYGDWVGEVEGYVIPHQDILECAYVLKPLSEILPDYVHPSRQKTCLELWQCFLNKGGVESIDFVWRERIISVAATLFLA